MVEEPEPEPDVVDEPIAVPFEPAPVDEPDEPDEPELEADDPNLIGDDEIIEVPFELVPQDEDEPLPDTDAWSSLLAELKTESVQPDENLPVLPDIEELRHRDRMRAEPAPVDPEPEPEPVAEEPAETTYELGISLEAFAESLGAAPEPEPEPEPEVAEEVLEEQELGMSLAELEESLKREKRA